MFDAWVYGRTQTKPLHHPVPGARRSSPFSSSRPHPVHGRVQPHSGVDYAVPIDTPVLAAADGHVSRVDVDGVGKGVANGHAIWLRHPDLGLVTAYLHLNKPLVEVGEFVSAGDLVGLSGETGLSSGPHLHFTVLRHGQLVDGDVLIDPDAGFEDSGLEDTGFEDSGLDEYGATGYVTGMDVSHYQRIDWSQVGSDPKDIAFVFIKISEGGSKGGHIYKGDDAFARDNAVGARRIGAKITYYHFASPDKKPSVRADAQDEAKVFLDKIKKLDLPSPDLPLILDFEKKNAKLSRREMTEWAITFMKAVERATGVTPLFYTYPSFVNEVMEVTPELKRFPLWIANVRKDASGSPTLPRGMTDWSVWQYSWTGRVKGARSWDKARKGWTPPGHGDVDLNVTTPAKLNALLRGAPLAARRPPRSTPLATRRPPRSTGGGGGGGAGILLLGGVALLAAMMAG